MPRHYDQGIPRRTLLEIQLLDVNELLDMPVAIYENMDLVPPKYMALKTKPLETKHVTGLNLLAHWIAQELEQVP